MQITRPERLNTLILDLTKLAARPQAQQIMVANLDEVKQHAF
ncbi:hypothetical protein [Rheinheimera maricola]|nr:hypothetical protein [Rheinheimera maricola]